MIETVFVVLWALLKVVFIVAVALLLIATIILLLHPIVVESKIRASLIGQKFYVKLRYLFNIIALEFEGTRYNQKTYLRIFSFRKLLNEKRRFKPKKDVSDSETLITPVVDSEPSSDAQIEVDDEIEAEREATESSELKSEAELESELVPTESSELNSEPYTDSEREATESSELKSEAEAEPELEVSELSGFKPEPEVEPGLEATESSEFKSEPKAEPKLETSETSEFESESEPKPSFEKKEKSNDIKQILRNLKKNVNSKITELRKQIKLFIKKWKIFWPVIKRLFKRGKRVISFEKTGVNLWYALPEPHLTGMLYGVMAILCDATKRIGIVFSFTPVFTQTTFYTVIDNRIILRPFFLAYALFMLIFEFSVYKECYSLYKDLKHKRSSAGSQNN